MLKHTSENKGSGALGRLGRVWTLAAVASMAALAACSTTSPDVIKQGDAQRLSQVADAVVLNVRPVVIEGSQSGLGGTTGAVLGGVAGAGSTGNSRGAVLAGVAGAVVGAVAGNAVERYGTREDALEILLQLTNGERRSVVQAKGDEVITSGGIAGVIRDIGDSFITVEVADGVTIRIMDNGTGLPPDRARLFEPYVTTREKGTGLGLPIVKKIIEEHGGSLALLDAPVFEGNTHMGAMAEIRLPRAPRASRARSKPAATAAQGG